MVASIMLCILVSFGVVYARSEVIKYYNQQLASKNFINMQNYDFSQDMEYSNKIYHKSIFTYSEYINYKKDSQLY